MYGPKDWLYLNMWRRQGHLLILLWSKQWILRILHYLNTYSCLALNLDYIFAKNTYQIEYTYTNQIFTNCIFLLTLMLTYPCRSRICKFRKICLLHSSKDIWPSSSCNNFVKNVNNFCRSKPVLGFQTFFLPWLNSSCLSWKHWFAQHDLLVHV